MDLKEIQELIKMMSKSGLAELKLKRGDFELVLKSEASIRDRIPAQLAPISALPAAPPTPVSTSGSTSAPEPPAATPFIGNEAKAASSYLEIKSPMVGTFYRSASPDKPPYIKVGDAVKNGQVVCMIEAMKLFNEIESEIEGVIVKILVEDAAPVEYDQVLFLVEPA
ncbi:MAG: acetyl-CoA carboxylase biotin carboxyl carrier protein [Saprospiraceae bacterium]|nr:acetyl-CoA carboxylase biotin carboxyl carrier protein [Saprospiraceae bacterium]